MVLLYLSSNTKCLLLQDHFQKMSAKASHYCLCNLKCIPDLMSVTLSDTVAAEIENY